mmetsp:Transcript_5326/g.17190  ORF Transcript_5326/g.17190 Transcript_5326/m.17190 type:complete len:154 (-) Transcript_5326:621-1082(-)
MAAMEAGGEPYWTKEGGRPPALNPTAAPPPPPPPAPAPVAQAYGQQYIPMAAPVYPQQGYYPPNTMQYGQQTGHYGQVEAFNYAQQPYPHQPQYPAAPPQGVADVRTITQQYCGPISWALGLIICFFTGCGCVVACCPCDSESVTYVNGRRVN